MKKSCNVATCTNISRRWGYCPLHAYRYHRYGNPLFTKNEAHGQTNTLLYKSYKSILARCFKKSSQGYKNYGARGITVCKGWQNSFIDFSNDIGIKPDTTYSIDRKDNNGNYSCGKCGECRSKGWTMNCRWATKSQQCSNRRMTLLTYDDKTLSVKEWADFLHIDDRKIYWRIKKGWTIDKTLTVI